MATPAVSVVIPTRNRLALLARALGTVLAQREVDVEVFVVDEASDDGTADFVRGLADPLITLIHHDRPKGVAGARNAGLARAQAAWVAFLDDDDLWAPTKLALQLDAVARAGARWVCAGEVIVDEALRIVSGKPPPCGHDLPQLLSYNTIPGGGSGAMVSTELARSIGGFDTALSILADWDMWIRLWLKAQPAFVMQPVVGYLRHQGSMSLLNHGFICELERIIAKHEKCRRPWAVNVDRLRWMRWVAQMHVRSGNRSKAVQGYLHLALQYRDGKSLGRALLGALSPGLMVSLWRRRSLRQLPADWHEQAETWLAPLRSANDHARESLSTTRSCGVVTQTG
jgi:glycosyltransferase involved in cell wall biosynthesis